MKNIIRGFGAVAVILLILIGLEHIDRYTTNAEVFVVYDGSAIEFITADGNTWLYETNDTEGIEVGDTCRVTFKEFENDNIYDDAIIKYVKVL